MFGYFRKVFGPINAEVTETFELPQSPNWERLTPHLNSNFRPHGNLLPSKKIANPVGHTTENSVEFTMNYMNMFFVMPSVKIEKIEPRRVKATYFYKAPWKWLQYYWFGFCTFLYVFTATFMLVGLIVDIFKFDATLREIILHQIFSLGPAIVGSLFLFFGLYFRQDLMGKAETLVSHYIGILKEV